MKNKDTHTAISMLLQLIVKNISKVPLYIRQKFIQVSQLQNLLVAHDKIQLKLIVVDHLEGGILVLIRSNAAASLLPQLKQIIIL